LPKLPGEPNPADRPVLPSQVLDFDKLYALNCAGCHGADGVLGPAPPLNNAVFLAIVPDDVLVDAITAGRPDTPMPGFAQQHAGTLTDAQIKALAAGIKPRWAKSESAAVTVSTIPSYLDAASAEISESDRKQGAALFVRACGGCHGDQGQGGDLAGEINNPDFLALISDQALRRYVITGRPDLGMPDYAGGDGRPDDFQPLTDQQVSDLVAYLASWRTSPGDGQQATSTKNP
jgi:cytochrome c oxidase cbb3-type subunit 3/ubiquinol-cytochrome c reductase cytochrome c subunit